MITLTAAAHPFEASSKTIPVAEGVSLQAMLEQAQPDPMLMRHAVIFIGGSRIERRYWHCVYPKAGALVEIRVLPTGGGGGGNKDALRIVLTLAVLVASVYIPGLPALALGPTSQAFLQAGIAVVGNLAVNALVPVEQPEGPREEERRFGIQGFQNRARPFDPVTQILGRHRIAPDYATRVFTEVVGQDQYLRAIFAWGVGPMEIDRDSIRIGETPISNFTGVQVENRWGFPHDAPRKLYSDTVFEDNLQILLGDQSNGSANFTGAQRRIAAAEADELSVDITFPAGLFGTGENTGNTLSARANITVRYREVGTSTWLVPTFTARTHPFATGSNMDFSARRKGVIRHGMTWDVPRGNYEVQLQCVGMLTSDNPRTNDVYWTALRAIQDQDPITSRVPVATTTVRIKATDQLNGVLDELNGIVTTLGKDWDGSAWVDDQPMTNPASLFRHVLQGGSNAVPLPDSRINLASLEDWHAFCTAKGFTCNTVITSGRSVWEVLAEVAACGRASPADVDGKWGVVIDRPQAFPVSHITPRNSSNFKAEKVLIELPHAFRIPFVNEDQNWRRDERRVYRTGFDASNATEFEELQLPGITNPDQVERMGRYRMAQGIQQPERFTFRQDMEFLTYQRGDRVKITHDVLLLGLASGRVKSVITDGSNNVTGLVLDETVEMESGENYGITIRTLDDPSVNRGVVTDVGQVSTITLSSSIPAVGGQPAVGRHDLFGFGLFGLETDDAQIISIIPRANAEANVTAVPYREVIYSGDDTPIPPFQSNLTPLPQLPAPLVRNVISDERVIALGTAGNLRIRVAFDVDPVSQSTAFAGSHIEVQQRSTGNDGEPYANAQVEEQTGGRVIIGGVRESETFDFRLRWVPQGGRLPGPWVTVPSHRVLGRATPPAGLAGLTLSAFGGMAYLRWDRPAEIDVQYGGEVRFRHSPAMTGATWGASNSIGDLARASAQLVVLPLKKGTYLARVIDQTGRISETTATVSTKQATVLDFAATDTIDEATAFSGAKTNLTVDSGTLELTDPAVSQTGVYDFAAALDYGAVVKRRLTSRIALVSFNVFDTIAQRTDLISTWTSIVGDIPDGGDLIVQVRHTDDDPSGTPEWTAWDRLDSAEFDARAFEFRALVSTIGSDVNVSVSELGIDADSL
jgi:hypothetical protein